MKESKERRNEDIRKQIELMQEMGFKIKDACKAVSVTFYLSSSRVQDIWYKKKC